MAPRGISVVKTPKAARWGGGGGGGGGGGSKRVNKLPLIF